MPTPRLSDELALEAARVYAAEGPGGYRTLGLQRTTFLSRVDAARRRGLLDSRPSAVADAITNRESTRRGFSPSTT